MVALAKTETPKQKLPRVVWHPGGRQYAARIGFKLYKRQGQEVRDRAFQLLGKDRAQAMRKALDIQDDWLWTLKYFQQYRPDEKPCWLPENEMRAYQAAERGDTETVYRSLPFLNRAEERYDDEGPTNDEQLATRVRTNVTLEQGKEMYLARAKSRIGLRAGKGLQEYTYITYKQDLNYLLKFIDRDMPLSQLTRSHIESFVNYWLACPNDISIRTAVDYCRTFKHLLDWLADHDEVDFVKPRGMDRIFRFQAFNPIHIEPYTNDQLKTLFAVLPDRYRFFVQLALNCGYYQSDIATLRYEHLLTFRNGIEAPVRDLAAFEGELFIKRRRQKTLHQNDFETLCYVWPENVELMRACAAPINNPHGLVLLNDEGLPLRRGRTNNITERINHYKVNAGLNRKLQFKQFRKTGATWIENRYGERVARMYAAHALNGELKRYVAQNFDPLAVALKAWANELRSDGVLSGVGIEEGE